MVMVEVRVKVADDKRWIANHFLRSAQVYAFKVQLKLDPVFLNVFYYCFSLVLGSAI